jgi:hypothetical protein
LRELPDALSAVIIGCEAKAESIKELVRKYAPQLPIKYAKKIGNKYKLGIV